MDVTDVAVAVVRVVAVLLVPETAGVFEDTWAVVDCALVAWAVVVACALVAVVFEAVLDELPHAASTTQAAATTG